MSYRSLKKRNVTTIKTTSLQWIFEDAYNIRNMTTLCSIFADIMLVPALLSLRDSTVRSLMSNHWLQEWISKSMQRPLLVATYIS
jgi:hypothetical protein